MTSNFYPTVFVPMKVSEGLPERIGTYNCIHGNIKRLPDEEPLLIGFGELQEVGEEKHIMFNSPNISEWIEPLTNRYVFSEDEYEQKLVDVLRDYSLSSINDRSEFVKRFLKSQQ